MILEIQLRESRLWPIGIFLSDDEKIRFNHGTTIYDPVNYSNADDLIHDAYCPALHT